LFSERVLLKLSWQQALRCAAWGCFCVIAILSLVPGSERPHTFLHARLEHFAAYAGTGFFFVTAYQGRRERWLAWIGLAFASVLFEILQKFVPGRSSNALDALASSLGATFGMLVGAYVSARLASRGVVLLELLRNYSKGRFH
jgi:VanZ family protein